MIFNEDFRVLLIGSIFFVLLFNLGCVNNTFQIDILNDYDKALVLASESNKKLLVIFDFLGNPKGANNEMVYDVSIADELGQYVVLVLNVDEPGESGEINMKLQLNKFGTSNQPMYYILDKRGQLLKGPLEYCNKSEFIMFIK